MLMATHTVLLKQGRTIKGTVTGQNLDHVDVDTLDGKHLVIPKKSVLKIIYRDLALDEEEKIRKAEETKREAEKQKLMEEKRKELLAKQAESQNTNNSDPSSSSAGGVAVKSTLRDSFILGSPNPSQSITLASFSQKCTPYSEYPEYFWLFGALRFREPNLTGLLPKDGKPMRISQKSTYTDMAITLLGGFLITITRKTLIIETCEGEGYRLISEKELNQIKDSAVSEIKTQQEIESIQEKVELELLESELKEMEKSRKPK